MPVIIIIIISIKLVKVAGACNMYMYSRTAAGHNLVWTGPRIRGEAAEEWGECTKVHHEIT